MGTPLHEMGAEQRVAQMKSTLDKYNVPEDKRPFVSYMMGVQMEHFQKASNMDLKAVGEAVANLTKEDAKLLGETNPGTTADVVTYDKPMMPMIMRGFAQSAATDICGLWPAKADTGKFFYMQNYYTNDQANPVSPAVGKILFVVDSSVFTVGGDITNSGTGEGVVRYIETGVVLIQITAGAFAANDSLDNANPYSAGATTCTRVAPPEIGVHVFTNYTKFANILAGETATTAIKEIELTVKSKSFEVENHKLRARFTREEMIRIRDYYGKDGQAIIDGIGALAFTQELNTRVFSEVRTGANQGGAYGWDYDVDADGRYEGEKIRTLLTRLNLLSAEILQANKIGLGNYIVIDPMTWAFLDSYGYLDKSMFAGGMANPMVTPYVGILNGRYKVYVNPWTYTRRIDMGFKDFSGSPEAQTRAGLYFIPYLAMDITKTIADASGQPITFFHSMFTFTQHPLSAEVGTNDFFRGLTLSNLPGAS